MVQHLLTSCWPRWQMRCSHSSAYGGGGREQGAGSRGHGPPGPVKISHKKDGLQRWLHRFHVSWPLDPLLSHLCTCKQALVGLETGSVVPHNVKQDKRSNRLSYAGSAIYMYTLLIYYLISLCFQNTYLLSITIVSGLSHIYPAII